VPQQEKKIQKKKEKKQQSQYTKYTSLAFATNSLYPPDHFCENLYTISQQLPHWEVIKIMNS